MPVEFCSDIFHGLFLAASVERIAACGVCHSRSILSDVTGPEAYCVVVPRHLSPPRGGLPERRYYYTRILRSRPRPLVNTCQHCTCRATPSPPILSALRGGARPRLTHQPRSVRRQSRSVRRDERRCRCGSSRNLRHHVALCGCDRRKRIVAVSS